MPSIIQLVVLLTASPCGSYCHLSGRQSNCVLCEPKYTCVRLGFTLELECSIYHWLGLFRVSRARLFLEEVRVASRGQEIVSVASQGDRLKCISCVPGFQPLAYELRPSVSKELHQLRRKIGVYNISNKLEGS